MKKYFVPDPRCTFAMSGYFSIFAVLAQNISTIVALLIMAIISSLILRINLNRVMGRLKRLLQVVVVVSLMQSIFQPSGQVLLEIGQVALITSGGLEKGIVVLCRLSILIIGGSLFTLYSSRELIQAMIQMKIPYEIAYMVSVGIRFVPMMGQELRDSLTALQLRGVVIENLKLKKRLKVYTYLLLPVVAGSLHNARSLAMSMEMRGFRTQQSRTSYFTLQMKTSDYCFFAAIILLTVLTGIAFYLI